jgi:hypothetical protein
LGGAMLESFKRLFGSRGEDHEPDHGDVAEWARGRGFGFKRVRDDAGFVIEGLLDGKPWRIEWGLPQRDYIIGNELRLRMELELAGDAQMLLLSRPLMEALERKTFEEFTDNVQTQIGTKSPEEMRWLVMFPKINLSTLKTLRARFGAVASSPEAGLAWITGPLADAIEQQAASGFLRDEPPFVLMTLRGRAYLRMQLLTPNVSDIAAALALFETAVARALSVGGAASGKSPEWTNSSASTAWQTLQTDEIADPRRKK